MPGVRAHVREVPADYGEAGADVPGVQGQGEAPARRGRGGPERRHGSLRLRARRLSRAPGRRAVLRDRESLFEELMPRLIVCRLSSIVWWRVRQAMDDGR